MSSSHGMVVREVAYTADSSNLATVEAYRRRAREGGLSGGAVPYVYCRVRNCVFPPTKPGLRLQIWEFGFQVSRHVLELAGMVPRKFRQESP